jgi:hemerythrin superfamily protein
MPATHSNATATKKASSPTRAPRKPPRRTRTTAPDALALLKDDHKRVDALFQRFAKLKEDGEQKAALVENICGELTIHTTLEEDVFYPAVRGAIGDDDLMDEAAVQHESARTLISEIMRMSPGDVYYDAKVAVLGEYIRHHVKEEQEQMFRKVRAANVDLKALGAAMAARKKELAEGTDAPGDLLHRLT